MCGRMNVTDHPGVAQLMQDLGIQFKQRPNSDLRPTNIVATIADIDGDIQQLDTHWGIKPVWSKKLLINAQAETVAEKKTFSKAFRERRCVIPCTGWYEWKDEGGRKKRRYLFSHAKEEPFYMAGIWYSGEKTKELVSLTTSPNKKCEKIHNRMPVLILPDKIEEYLSKDAAKLSGMLHAVSSRLIKIGKYHA